MPIHTLTRRYPRLGRVTAGRQVKNQKGDIHPKREKTFVFTSDSLERLEVLAGVYGGTPEKSPTASADQDKYVLVSATMRIRVRLPASVRDPRTWSQWLEAWATSGLVRRCDGIECVIRRAEPTVKTEKGRKVTIPGELLSDPVPCICDAQQLEGDQRCKPTVRLNVLLADKEIWQDMSGVGVWAVQSGGWGTNEELASDIDMIAAVLGDSPAGMPAILDLHQVPSRHGPVPRMKLTLESTPADLMALRGVARIADLPDVVRPELDAAADETPVGTFIRPEESDTDAEVVACAPESSSDEARVVEEPDPAPVSDPTPPPPHAADDLDAMSGEELELELAGLLDRHKIPDRDADAAARRVIGSDEPVSWRQVPDAAKRTLILQIRTFFVTDQVPA